MAAAVHNLREYLVGLDAWLPAVEGAGDRLHRAVCLALLRPFVFGTPVDTGYHRGQWQVGHDTPPEGEIDRRDPDGRSTVAVGAAEIARAKLGEITWIANNGPAIVPLEDGWSPQNRGWVRAAVEHTRATFP